MTFLDCPAYLSKTGTTRCGLPAEVQYRYTIESSDGPLESAKIHCPRGHWFNGPIESLTTREQPTVAGRISRPAAAADHAGPRHQATGSAFQGE